MMKFLYLAFCFLSYTSLSAQFAKIQDKDGYVNLRKDTSQRGEIIGKLMESDLFWCVEPEGNWYFVDVQRTDTIISGYVHKSRVKFIHEYPAITKKRVTPSRVVFQEDSIKIEITKKAFDAKEHTFQYESNGGHQYITEIDNAPFFGTDGGMPTQQYQSISLTINNNRYELPKEAIVNLYEPGLDLAHTYVDKKNNVLYIDSINSDGAGTYVVIWIIRNGKYEKRITLIPF